MAPSPRFTALVPGTHDVGNYLEAALYEKNAGHRQTDGNPNRHDSRLHQFVGVQLYFKTKEELFKAVIKNVVIRRVDALIEGVESTELSPEEYLRGPLLDFMKKVPGSPIAIVIRLPDR